ncbi:MAG: DNA mismatch repair protein MutS [Thermoguttaceae bacterium]|jgi:DNA mismatch repair protein MutS
MKQTSETPMMRQYAEAKRAAGDALLLFRMGDFYELFYDDAHLAGNLLGLTVTTRDRHKGPDAMPMAGFPHHQLDLYLAKLINAGCKVAVCEQMEDPKKAKTIVKREVIRVVTPGTVMDDTILDPKTSNYLVAVTLPAKPDLVSGEDGLPLDGDGEAATRRPKGVAPEEKAGVAWVELSTGEFTAATVPFREVADLLARIHPAELLIPENFAPYFPEHSDSPVRTLRPDWTFALRSAVENLHHLFRVTTLEGFSFSPEADPLAISAAGGVYSYLRETQKQSLDHIETLKKYQPGLQLEIDEASQRSLEILRNSRDGRREGSLLGAVDTCITPMGSRLLASWLAYPLTDIAEIVRRQDAVAELLDGHALRDLIRAKLRSVSDLARTASRVAQRRVSPRDLVGIRKTLEVLPEPKTELARCASPFLKSCADRIHPLEDFTDELRRALGDDTPLNYREGGFIVAGYDTRLDELRDLQTGGKRWLAEFQASEIRKTGIPTLKVGFNSVFGYYIEVTRAHSDKVPGNYIRKQTLKNAERYITEELKVYEEKVLRAEEEARVREFELFDGLVQLAIDRRAELQANAAALANLDVLASMADVAAARGYCRPKMVEEPILHLRDGRHPVLDAADPGNFVPNDADCSPDKVMIHLITGPNMAGKSTYIRQIALLVLLAQTGSFIPASEAEIGITDRIFARIGASDELTRGMSTFMVEMIETARILNGATRRSLVILDEIGRGTSTYDGISLAWGIVEALSHRPLPPGLPDTVDGSKGCRTFFATHYHELTNLSDTCSGVDNLNVAVREWDEQIAFLHKIVPGPADRSYGIHVARLAGVPRHVIRRAQTILDTLEASHLQAARDALGGVLKSVGATPFDAPEPPRSGKRRKPTVQFSLFGPEDHPVIDEIRSVDVENLTPLQAMTLISRWKEELE